MFRESAAGDNQHRQNLSHGILCHGSVPVEDVQAKLVLALWRRPVGPGFRPAGLTAGPPIERFAVGPGVKGECQVFGTNRCRPPDETLKRPLEESRVPVVTAWFQRGQGGPQPGFFLGVQDRRHLIKEPLDQIRSTPLRGIPAGFHVRAIKDDNVSDPPPTIAGQHGTQIGQPKGVDLTGNVYDGLHACIEQAPQEGLGDSSFRGGLQGYPLGAQGLKDRKPGLQIRGREVPIVRKVVIA